MMNTANTVIVGLALILGISVTVGVIGAKLDLPIWATGILGGCAAILAVIFGIPA